MVLDTQMLAKIVSVLLVVTGTITLLFTKRMRKSSIPTTWDVKDKITDQLELLLTGHIIMIFAFFAYTLGIAQQVTTLEEMTLILSSGYLLLLSTILGLWWRRSG